MSTESHELTFHLKSQLEAAARMLQDSVTLDSNIRGGVPVVRGTRVPVARILAEVADDASLSEISDDLDLDREVLIKLINGLANYLDRPVCQ